MPLLTPITVNHSHTSGTSEQTVYEYSDGVAKEFKDIWLDMRNLTKDHTIRLYRARGSYDEPVQTMNWQYGIDSADVEIAGFTTHYDWKLTLQSVVAEGSTKIVGFDAYADPTGPASFDVTVYENQ